MTLQLDIVSDIVCPWCFIGITRIEQAVAALGVLASYSFQPFLLDPTTPEQGQDLRQRLKQKYGRNPEEMFRQVEAAGASSGLKLDFKKVQRSVNTVRAHTLLRHALSKGTQHALALALFRAYFLESKDVSDLSVLLDLAIHHGFEESEAHALLSDETELALTRSEARLAADQGIQGVPFTIVNEKLAIPGAQSVAVFQQAFQQALTESTSPEG